MRFHGRLQLFTFQVSPLPPRCRSLRLRILQTRDPQTAGCLQLACWNIYSAPFTHLAARQVAGTPAPAPASTASESQPKQDAVAVQEKEVQEWAGRVAGACAAGALAAQVPGRVLGVLKNLQRVPAAAKFGRLRVAKAQAMLASGEVLALLLAVGFRPVMARWDDGGGRDEAALMMEERGQAAATRRVAAAVTCLEAAGFGSEASSIAK